MVLAPTITIFIINALDIKIRRNELQIPFSNVTSCSVLIIYQKRYIVQHSFKISLTHNLRERYIVQRRLLRLTLIRRCMVQRLIRLILIERYMVQRFAMLKQQTLYDLAFSFQIEHARFSGITKWDLEPFSNSVIVRITSSIYEICGHFLNSTASKLFYLYQKQEKSNNIYKYNQYAISLKNYIIIYP